MPVIRIDVHLAILHHSQGSYGRGRIVHMHHEIGVFILRAWRRVRTIRFNCIRTHVSNVMCVDRRQSRPQMVSHDSGMRPSVANRRSGRTVDVTNTTMKLDVLCSGYTDYANM